VLTQKVSELEQKQKKVEKSLATSAARSGRRWSRGRGGGRHIRRRLAPLTVARACSNVRPVAVPSGRSSR
jgi:hypothetical protein